MKHLNITIVGKVQGVFFRRWLRERANTLNIRGFASNKPDGSVYVEAEGDAESLEEFLLDCKKGPLLAKVINVITVENDMKSFDEFTIK